MLACREFRYTNTLAEHEENYSSMRRFGKRSGRENHGIIANPHNTDQKKTVSYPEISCPFSTMGGCVYKQRGGNIHLLARLVGY